MTDVNEYGDIVIEDIDEYGSIYTNNISEYGMRSITSLFTIILNDIVSIASNVTSNIHLPLTSAITVSSNYIDYPIKVISNICGISNPFLKNIIYNLKDTNIISDVIITSLMFLQILSDTITIVDSKSKYISIFKDDLISINNIVNYYIDMYIINTCNILGVCNVSSIYTQILSDIVTLLDIKSNYVSIIKNDVVNITNTIANTIHKFINDTCNSIEIIFKSTAFIQVLSDTITLLENKNKDIHTYIVDNVFCNVLLNNFIVKYLNIICNIIEPLTLTNYISKGLYNTLNINNIIVKNVNNFILDNIIISEIISVIKSSIELILSDNILLHTNYIKNINVCYIDVINISFELYKTLNKKLFNYIKVLEPINVIKHVIKPLINNIYLQTSYIKNVNIIKNDNIIITINLFKLLYKIFNDNIIGNIVINTLRTIMIFLQDTCNNIISLFKYISYNVDDSTEIVDLRISNVNKSFYDNIITTESYFKNINIIILNVVSINSELFTYGKIIVKYVASKAIKTYNKVANIIYPEELYRK